MEWVRENWVFLVFFIFSIAIYFFGHGMRGGGCGGHDRSEEGGEHKGHSGKSSSEKKGGHGCC